METRMIPASAKESSLRRAFTLVELLVVIAIVAILAGLTVAGYDWFLARAEKGKCIANMKNIHAALVLYRNDNHGQWPQENPTFSARERADFWYLTLKKYDVSREVWRCPTQVRLGKQQGESESEDKELMNYSVTPFGPGKSIASRWEKMPWLAENGSPHGDFGQIMLPNGALVEDSEIVGSGQ